MRTRAELLEMTEEEIMDDAIRYAESTIQADRNLRDLLTKDKPE